MTALCRWCKKPLPSGPVKGCARKFCGPGCRNQFWSAARKWIARAVETGLLPVEALQTDHGLAVHGSPTASATAAAVRSVSDNP